MAYLLKIGLLCFLVAASSVKAETASEATPKTAAKATKSDVLTEADLERFSSWIAGDWDNIAQIEQETSDGVADENMRQRYAMRYTEINTPNVKGRTFAIENYDDGRGFKGAMERVSLHRFILNDNNDAIVHEILFLKDKAFRKSLVNSLKPLENINENDISARESCRLYWHWTGKRFEGATQKGACVTSSYTDREITVEGTGVLGPELLMRHDRNFEMSGEEILRPGASEADRFKRVSNYTGSYVRRPTIVVSDMERALSLYRDILGLKLSRINQDSADSYAYTVFNIPNGTKVQHAMLDADNNSRALSLVEVPGTPTVDANNGVRKATILFNANGRLQQIRERLIQENYQVLPMHQMTASISEFGFIDADGHLIALYEITE